MTAPSLMMSVFTALLCTVACSPAPSPSATRGASDGTAATPSLDLLDAGVRAALAKSFKLRRVETPDDPATNVALYQANEKDKSKYHRAVWEGYALEDVVTVFRSLHPEFPWDGARATGEATAMLSQNIELRLRATDGWVSSAPLARLLNEKGVIATRLVSLDGAAQPPGENWPRIVYGGKEITLAPHFLVWDRTSYDDKSRLWPWMLSTLQVGTFDAFYAAAKPKNPAYERGFRLFAAECLQCHAVNGVGGKGLGEFDGRTNIQAQGFSYFMAFGTNPKDFSESPATFPHPLPEGDYRAMWDYLEHVKESRAKVPLLK